MFGLRIMKRLAKKNRICFNRGVLFSGFLLFSFFWGEKLTIGNIVLLSVCADFDMIR